MKDIPDESVDMILADLPYGIIRNDWDVMIPLAKLWEQYDRIIKEHGCIALFGTEKFSTKLAASNLKEFRYRWYWEKNNPVGFLNANRMPLKNIEEINIFYKHLPTYNPVMTKGKPYVTTSHNSSSNYDAKKSHVTINDGVRFPKQVIHVRNDNMHQVHPTQKPVELLEYLIQTYTNEYDVVLDNTMGSGSTGVAAINLNRDFIGMEIQQNYFEIAKDRIKKAITEKVTIASATVNE
ncbi:MAG: site-specific DNA-methyltransferase [Lactobacillus sp.]|nr:site-specific DNA-methyltransferase [Lactobacillus sp.]MBD5430818.1 site-specific DNA-methyltransferase [Lactobacillus sp.]